MNGYYDPTPDTISMMAKMPDELIKYCTSEAVKMYRKFPDDGTYSEWLEAITSDELWKLEHKT